MLFVVVHAVHSPAIVDRRIASRDVADLSEKADLDVISRAFPRSDAARFVGDENEPRAEADQHSFGKIRWVRTNRLVKAVRYPINRRVGTLHGLDEGWRLSDPDTRPTLR